MRADLEQLSNSLEVVFSRRGAILIRGDRIFRLNQSELSKLVFETTRTRHEESVTRVTEEGN